MRNLAAIFAIFAVAASGAPSTTNNPSFRFPVRVIGSQRVDLRPLFAHWKQGTDAVTNSPWVLLTGTIASDRGGMWVIDGRTTSASGVELHQKVLLMHPPRAEKESLDTLLAEQSELKKENSGLKGEENSLKKKAASPPKPTRHHWVSPNYRAIMDQKETNVLNEESSVESRLNQISKQLAAIPTTSSHAGTVYRVDFFALSTGEVQNGMPVLDFGTPTR